MMLYRPEPWSAMGRGGMAAVVLALGVLTLAWVRMSAGGALPLLLLLLLWAAGIGTIILLSRTRMPTSLRAVLIVMLVGTMLFAAAIGQLFGSGTVANGLDQAGDAAARSGDGGVAAWSGGRSIGPRGAAMPAGGASGARVALAAAPVGDGGWAATLNEALDHRLGGARASALTVTGDVSASRQGGVADVAVAWSIGSANGIPAACGTTRGVGGDRAALVDQVGQSIEGAVTRSVALGRPACP